MNRTQQYFFLGAVIIVGLFLLRDELPFAQRGKVSHDEFLLSGFEDKKTWGIDPERGFSIKLSRKHVTEGKYSLEVNFPKWNLPSINTKKLKNDWGRYEYFIFDVFNPHKEEIGFEVRLDDTNKKRVSIPYPLQPGMNKVVLSYSKIASKINAENIRFVVLFINEPRKRYRLFFDNMRLEKSEAVTDVAKELKPLIDEGNRSLKEKISVSKINPSAPTGGAVVSQVPLKGELKVALAKLKEVENNKPFLSTGIPFAPGQLKSIDEFIFYDLQGNEIPIAAKILAKWPQDHSIRSVLVQFSYPIKDLFEYAVFKWGVKRQTKDLQIIEPNWQIPEGYIVMPAEWLCNSQVAGEHVPLGKGGNGQYDQNILTYWPQLKGKEKVGNLRIDGYYSTPHTLYQIYVRSGDLQYFLDARQELLHYRQNETQLEGPHRGASYVATNVGRYTYIEAMRDDYLLTGDPRTLEVAGYMAEFLKKNSPPDKAYLKKGEDRFWTERHFASPMLGVLTYYEMTLDQTYLNIAQEYMDNLYRTQLEWPTRGGFIHNLHSHDPSEGARPDEYGGSPFMTGLLLEAIINYHKITGSKKAEDSIFRALDWLINEGLDKNGTAFKYMTADNYAEEDGAPDLTMLIVHGLGYGYRLSGYQRKEYLDVAQRVFDLAVEKAFLKSRKHFNQNYRSSGHYLAYIRDGIKDSFSPFQVRNANDQIQEGFLIKENFDDSTGGFSSGSDTLVSLEASELLNTEKSLRIQSKRDGSSLSAGISFDVWSLNDFSFLNFSYVIPSGTPVGMRVKTDFGDWVCIGGTASYRCEGNQAKESFLLLDDGQKHEAKMDARLIVQSLLSGINRLKEFQFYTQNNAQHEQRFWIDEFDISRAETVTHQEE